MNGIYDLYVDGSEYLGRVGYGWVLLLDGTELQRGSGPVPPEQVEGARQVAGELMAVGHALRWCKAHGIDRLRLHYDYQGIENWATGRWKARKALTQRYAEFMRTIGIQIEFLKVKSHSGDHWNDVVDQLARSAAQAQAPDSEALPRLRRIAPLWIAWLCENGYHEVEFVGLMNNMFARFEIRQSGRRTALFDVYDTQAKPLHPYIHACPDATLKSRLMELWAKVRPQYLKLT